MLDFTDTIRILQEIRDTEESKMKLSREGQELHRSRIGAINQAIEVLDAIEILKKKESKK